MPSIEASSTAASTMTAAAMLPPCYLVTPEVEGSKRFLSDFVRCLQRGIKLTVFRNYQLSDTDYLELLEPMIHLAKAYDSHVMIHNRITLLEASDAKGLHLSAAALMAHQQRPIDSRYWLAASCHNERELAHAAQLGIDFASVGPVHKTASHPNVAALGWQGFQSLVSAVDLPVYAIGGLAEDDLSHSQQHGACGIAAIRSLWEAQ